MNIALLVARLERFPDILDATIASFSADDLRWKPSPKEWSALEVAAHLADEEALDFRPRLRSTLESPGAPWPPIDPEGWVVAHGYARMEVAEVLARFRRERAASVAWLRTLADPDWSASYAHPKAGPISAGDLATSWAAHDALHLRQLAKIAWQLAVRDGEGSAEYAGNW